MTKILNKGANLLNKGTQAILRIFVAASVFGIVLLIAKSLLYYLISWIYSTCVELMNDGVVGLVVLLITIGACGMVGLWFQANRQKIIDWFVSGDEDDEKH